MFNNIVAVVNQKGGVGKTTTCVNLSASLAATKNKVLLIDLDPQGNATMGSGIEKDELKYSLNDVLMQRANINSVIVKSVAGYYVLPSNRDLTESEINLVGKPESKTVLQEALKQAKMHFDFILIDCPPSLNMLTINALVAADSVFIPMQCEYYALEGLASLIKTIDQIKDTINEKLHLHGILRTMYDGRNKLAKDVSKQLISYFGEKVYRTIIPRNVRLAEAPSHGLPALLYDKYSQGATAYLVLAGEILRKYKKIK